MIGEWKSRTPIRWPLVEAGRGSVGSGVWQGDRSDRRAGVNTGANEHTLNFFGPENHVIDS